MLVANVLTIPDPSCCNKPLPEPNGPDDKQVDVRRERIDCMLLDNKNGTLLDVFGIEPPYGWNGAHIAKVDNATKMSKKKEKKR